MLGYAVGGDFRCATFANSRSGRKIEPTNARTRICTLMVRGSCPALLRKPRHTSAADSSRRCLHLASSRARNPACGAGLALGPNRFDFARERAVDLVYQLGMPDQNSHDPGDFDPALQSRVDEIDLSSRDLFEYRCGKLEDELEILARRRHVDLPILEAFAVREQHHEVAQLAGREIERARIADNLRQHVEGATRGFFID